MTPFGQVITIRGDKKWETDAASKVTAERYENHDTARGRTLASFALREGGQQLAVFLGPAPESERNQMTTYNYADVHGHRMFYREAGDKSAPKFVLLHGFPTSSHMYRNLIPKLSDNLHVIAPDYIGFGYSDAPNAAKFSYTFDNLAAQVEELLFGVLRLEKFSIYVQDYGAPVGYRIASKHPEAIDSIVVQNGNAYVEGIGAAFDPMKPFWANRNKETEKPVRGLLSLETTMFQYTHGAKNPKAISPDNWTFDQVFLDRPGNDAIQLDLLHNYSSNVALLV